ncbi:TA system VapC family ribonuclease toxin [Variovorax soli]|jgi:toxin-antitoxin system PIN domain toxin|uniref:TA system VapC family ribonuclease toxin n=1 Tax=Variovorax soli TaxID=376815 RepID=UPI000837EF75|nr:TA system VapC family ribonuclease toxin [Variovorax soli]
MTVFLLDVNMLIALIDPAHVHHDLAHNWFARKGRKGFATCPLTENGLLRIVGNPKYPNSPGPPSAVAPALAALRALPGHVFWPDTVSIADPDYLDASLLSNHARVTDSYLLALAHAQGGKLASLDRRLATEAVSRGASTLELL